MATLEQLKKDYQSAISGGVIPKAGDTMNWGGGTLTRGADQRLKYSGGNYETYLDANTDLTALAKASPGIRQQWASQYGVDLGADAAGQAATTNAINNVVTGGVAPGSTFNLGSNGLGNYSVSNQNGALTFNTPGGAMSWDQFKQSNDYKALTGLNPSYAPAPTPAPTPAPMPAPMPGPGGSAPVPAPSPAPGMIGTPPAPSPAPTPAPTGMIGNTVAPTPVPNGVTPSAVATANTSTADAVTREVQGNETVQGQLGGLLTKGNPIFDKAVAKSQQSANERGLLNSSMAGEAGVSALLDSALNIAGADAATYQTAARDNQSVSNQANQFNATAKNQGSQFNTTQQNQQSQQLLQGQQDIQKIKESGAQDIAKLQTQGNVEAGLQQLKNQGLIQTAQIEAMYKGLTQASSSATAIMSNLQKVYNEIQSNPDLDAAAKQAMIADNVAIADRAMKVIGAAAGDVDLSTYLDGILGG